MKKIRSFLYLDNYKMYSFSSQLFEGLTEYIVKSEQTRTQSENSQKGQFGSGRIIADIIEKNAQQSEKKFLHDYSYNLFEEALIEQNRVLEISSNNFIENIRKISDYSFIKITGKVIFNDAKILEENTLKFNDFGEAIGYITNFKSFEKLREANKNLNNITDRNKKAKNSAFLNNAQTTALKQYLVDSGLHLDEAFVKNLAYLLNYGYDQQFEIQIPILDETGNCSLFSAPLIRENLKESELNIIKKYSRESERDFKLFGVLSQTLNEIDRKKHFNDFREKLLTQQEGKQANMKEAILGILEKMADVENVFIGKLDYEYVIDPIAIYLEI